MPGAPDPVYVLARRVLLDALQALGEQRSAVVLVGAQAIYLHTCATILLMAGKHRKYVQELLGHASINITLDTYSHVIEGMDGGLADAMDDAL